VPGPQLSEPLAERIRIPVTLGERLQVSQQRHGQVVVAWLVAVISARDEIDRSSARCSGVSGRSSARNS